MERAQQLGQPISIILPNRELAAHIQERVRARGWAATTHGLDAPTPHHIFARARTIAAKGGRPTIVLGCTAWAALADELRAEVAADIVEPEATAVTYLVDRFRDV
jgi:Asp/Glu/hydantoin racemase